MFKTTSTTTTYFYDEEGKLTDKMVTRSFHTGDENEDIKDEQEQEQYESCFSDDYDDNEDYLTDETLSFEIEPEVELRVERNFGLTDILRIVSGCIWAANIVMALRALRRMKGRV